MSYESENTHMLRKSQSGQCSDESSKAASAGVSFQKVLARAETSSVKNSHSTACAMGKKDFTMEDNSKFLKPLFLSKSSLCQGKDLPQELSQRIFI